MIMASNNLTPTPVVDKNGRQTTVYRKGAVSPVVKSLPKVSHVADTVVSDRDMLIESLVDGYSAYGLASSSLPRELASYPDEVLDALWELYDADPEGRASSLGGMVRRRIMYDHRDVSGVREALRFFPIVHGFYSYRVLSPIVDSLHRYSELPACEDFTQQPESVQRQCDALLTVHRELLDSYPMGINQGAHILKSSELIDLIMREPDKAERIGRIIGERKSDDVAMIREVLSAEVKSMSSGVL